MPCTVFLIIWNTVANYFVISYIEKKETIILKYLFLDQPWFGSVLCINLDSEVETIILEVLTVFS